MLLETGARPIQALPMQRVYKYMTKDKNMPGHRLSKQAWNIGNKVQKTRSKFSILDLGWVFDIMQEVRIDTDLLPGLTYKVVAILYYSSYP